jgi:hypothetical protein
MLNFTSNLKIYLFKEKNKVSLSVKVSDSLVTEYTFTIDEFNEFVSCWDKPQGVNAVYSGVHWSVLHKTTTPRPEASAANYVRLSAYKNGIGMHHRVDYIDMLNVRKDYFYQQNNKMYWD